MKQIEFERWEPDAENPRRLNYAGQRTAEDVFHELETRLDSVGYLPDEYFLLDADWEDRRDARCPETPAFSVGQTTAEVKASIWMCFWNGTRTVSAGQSIS